MIGVINTSKIFEFRDEYDMAHGIGWFFDKYDSDVVFVADASNKIKAVIKDGNLLFPTELQEETTYYLYGTVTRANIDLVSIKKNDFLPSVRNWQAGPFRFKFVNQKLPKELDI